MRIHPGTHPNVDFVQFDCLVLGLGSFGGCVLLLSKSRMSLYLISASN